MVFGNSFWFCNYMFTGCPPRSASPPILQNLATDAFCSQFESIFFSMSPPFPDVGSKSATARENSDVAVNFTHNVVALMIRIDS